MIPERRYDLATGIVLCVISAWVWTVSSAMPVLRRGLGPGGYPKFIAAGLGVLGFMLCIQALVRRSCSAGGFVQASGSFVRVICFALSVFVFVQILPYVGFIAASALFLFFGMRFFGYARLMLSLTVSIVVPMVLYCVFRYFFLVLIPVGSLFG